MHCALCVYIDIGNSNNNSCIYVICHLNCQTRCSMHTLMSNIDDGCFSSLRFYIGCDLCTNWYHGDCVGITEKEAKKMDDYICVECKRGQESSTEELYCICQTPYDESQ